MHRTDRLLGIVLHLQAHGHAAAATLARQFEVSRRTILRDIEALSLLGVPIESESGPGGGFRLLRGYFLPPLAFQAEEAWALLTGLRSLLAHGGVPRRAALAQVADKIAAVLDPRTAATAERMARRVGLHVWGADPGPWLDHLAQAILDGTRLTIGYDGPNGPTEREVDPYLLYSQQGFWQVQGFCHLRQGIRIFRTDRIRTLRPSGRTFVPPPDVDVAAPYAYRRPPVGAAPNVRLRCTPAVAQALAGSPEWANDLQPDGTLVRWMPPSQFRYIARLLLGFGPGLVVEEPPELRQMLAELAREIAVANGEIR